WIGTALIVRGSVPLGLDPLYAFFQTALGLEPQLVNTGVREMNRRAGLLGERYPFVVHGEYAVQSKPAALASTYLTIALMAPGNPVREYLSPAPDEAMA